MAWLKNIDEAAGSRDRMHESKPSTYCTMELVDADEADAENLEPSPTLLPTAMPNLADIPALSLRVPAEPPTNEGLLPDGHAAMRGAPESGAGMSQAMATAAAAALLNAHAGGPAPPPLAWLYSQQLAHAIARSGGWPTPASLLAPQEGAPAAAHHPDLPAALAAAVAAQSQAAQPQGGAQLPPMPPAWVAAAQAAQAQEALSSSMLASGMYGNSSLLNSSLLNSSLLSSSMLHSGMLANGMLANGIPGGIPSGMGVGVAPSPLGPLAAPGNWDDLDDLFAHASADDDNTQRAVEADSEDRDKPGDPLCLSPPLASAMAAVRVDGSLSPFELDKKQPSTSPHSTSPQTTMASGLENPPALPNVEEEKESEVDDFLATLLAVDPVV